MLQQPDQTAPARRTGDPHSNRYERLFGDALRVGESVAANDAVARALTAGLSAPGVQSRVIAPAMRKIGTLWERGVLTVADEHLATAVSYQALTRLYPALMRSGPRDHRRIIMAAAHGEHHVLGLRMAADVLEGAGFDVRFLGADVPASSLEAWITEHEPDVVALSLTMPLGAGALARQLSGIRARHPDVTLVLGGQGVPHPLRSTPGIAYVANTERLVETVEWAIAHPTPLDLPDEIGRGGVVRPVPTPAFDQTNGIGTIEDRLSAATAAAADSARTQAHRAFTLEQMAFHDPLTGLWNRRGFEDHQQRFIADGDPPALLMIDVDRFKAVNDTYGHEAGDQALIGVARSIIDSIRPGDVAVRFGGDEFAVLLPGATPRDAVAVGERLRAHVEATLTDPAVSVSIGVCAGQGSDGRRMTLDVDEALYEAKKRGRNQVALAGGSA
jgi:diguanylate cyclase (GGDEF)-like protein